MTPGNLLKVSRYINRNPIETKVHLVKNMQKYPYNTYAYYKNNTPYPFLVLGLLPSLLSPFNGISLEEYCKYREVEEEEAKQYEITKTSLNQ